MRFLLKEQPPKLDEETLLHDPGIETRCQALLASLATEQRNVLLAFAQGKKLYPKSDIGAELLKKLYLVQEQEGQLKITIPILEGFLRRQGLETQKKIFIHPTTQEVLVDGNLLEKPLTRQEFRLLSFLLTRPGRICTKDEIAEEVWEGAPEGVSNEAIDKLVQRLRSKIEKEKTKPKYLITYHGRGYQLKVQIDKLRRVMVGAEGSAPEVSCSDETGT